MIATHNIILQSFVLHKDYTGALNYWNLLKSNRINHLLGTNTINDTTNDITSINPTSTITTINNITLYDHFKSLVESDNSEFNMEKEFNNKSFNFKPNAVTISIMIKVANELNQINLINTFYEMVKQYQLVS